MASKPKFEWHGAQVAATLQAAQVDAVNRIMAKVVQHAKANHDAWQNQTGILEGGIRVVDYAAPTATGAAGLWGVADVVYARRMELGFQGTDAKGRHVNAQPRPWLRPAADAVYGGDQLAQQVARSLKRLSKARGGGGGAPT